MSFFSTGSNQQDSVANFLSINNIFRIELEAIVAKLNEFKVEFLRI
jgi:hypothetical protein